MFDQMMHATFKKLTNCLIPMVIHVDVQPPRRLPNG